MGINIRAFGEGKGSPLQYPAWRVLLDREPGSYSPRVAESDRK